VPHAISESIKPTNNHIKSTVLQNLCSAHNAASEPRCYTLKRMHSPLYNSVRSWPWPWKPYQQCPFTWWISALFH